MMGQKWETTYPGAREDVFSSAVNAVADQGWSITDAKPEVGVLSFHTGPRFWAPRGIKLTATFSGDDGSTAMVVVGPMDAIAAFGEQGRIARRFIAALG